MRREAQSAATVVRSTSVSVSRRIRQLGGHRANPCIVCRNPGSEPGVVSETLCEKAR